MARIRGIVRSNAQKNRHLSRLTGEVPVSFVPCTFCRRLLYWLCCPTQTGSREGVDVVDIILNFLMSVGAGIASHYICKWLSRHRKGQ